MRKPHMGSVSPRVSLLIGAVGVFIFFGILSGWFASGDTALQVATPPSEIVPGGD